MVFGKIESRPDRVPTLSQSTRKDGPPAGAARIGNAGVGILEAPGTAAVSAGLAKWMAIHENKRLRFEATFTNVLNRTNYAPPATNWSSPSTFGILNAQQTAENAGNRTGQVALRFDF